MDMALTSRLTLMKERVEQAATKVAQLQGRLDGINDRLRNEFGVNSLKEADEKLNTLDAELVEKEKMLADNVAALEIEFNKLED